MTQEHSVITIRNIWRATKMGKEALIVVDMQYMFHRHKYYIREEEEKRDGAPMLSFNGVETARLYFAMKDFAEIVAFARSNNADMCVCLDSKTMRKDENAEYKANRVKLQDRDLEALENIERVLRGSGFSVIKEEGYEADDCIAAVVGKKKADYDAVLIFTPDSDMCVHIDDKVRIARYKSVYSKYGNNGKHLKFMDAHALVNMERFEQYLSAEYKTYVPYNTVALYKATVGDSSDHIPGIKGFGPKAFEKLIDTLKANYVDFSQMVSYDFVEETIKRCSDILGGGAKVAEALASLEMVRSRTCENIEKQIDSISYQLPSSEQFQSQLAVFGITSIK